MNREQLFKDLQNLNDEDAREILFRLFGYLESGEKNGFVQYSVSLDYIEKVKNEINERA